jgi:peptide/nickel transport system substrate-binding protein
MKRENSMTIIKPYSANPFSSLTHPTRRGVLGGLGIGLLGLTTGVRTTLAQEVKKPGGTLVVAINEYPPALSILVTGATITNCVSGQIFNNLLKLSTTGKVLPNLAKAWKMSDNGMSYTFNLEPNVTWHDGTPFTSEDVRYSMLELNGKFNSLAQAATAQIAGIETPDPLTVVVKMKQADPAFFPWAFSQQEQALIHPKHIYEGTDVRMNPANQKPIGTGAFKLVEAERGSHITLEKNPTYFHKDAIFVDRLIFQVIPDEGARRLALENGDVDYIPYFCLSAATADALDGEKKVKVFDSVRPARGEILAYMNLRHPQLQKKEVRQAISYAIDREVLVKLALNGRGKAATGPIRSDHTEFYNPNVTKYKRDVAKANALLDKAGATRNGATRFNVKLAYQGSAEGGALQAAGEIMREQLKEVGIDLVLAPGDFAAVWDQAYLQWNFDMAMGSFFTGPDPKISVSPKYLSTNIRKANGANLMGYTNLDVDKLLKAADVEIDAEKRGDLYRQAQAILVDELPALWLWEKTYPSASSANVVGLPSGMNHWESYENVGFKA